MSLTQRTDYAEQASGRLLQIFKEQPNWVLFMEAIAGEFQELENVFWDVRITRWIDNASNQTLENVADIVGLTTQGWTDAQLRRRIKAQILLNKGSGTIKQIARIFETIYPSGSWKIQEYPPAGFQLLALGLSTGLTPSEIEAIGTELGAILQKAKGDAIKANLILGPDEPVFTFDEAGVRAWDSGKWAAAF